MAGVSSKLAEGVLDQAKQWFALPEATKQQIALSPERHYRGYQVSHQTPAAGAHCCCYL